MHGVGSPGVYSHVKGVGTLVRVVPRRDVDFEFWYPLGYGQYF